MSDTNSSTESESGDTAAAKANPYAASNSAVGPQRRPLLRTLVAVCLAVIAIALLQTFVAPADHQNANMASLVVGLFGSLYVLCQLFRVAWDGSFRWLLVLAAVVGLSALASLLRFEGFSGELWPQFSWRFEPQPQLRSLTESVPSASSVETGLASDARIAAADWPGFLGPDRNGVLKSRLFAVPESTDQLTKLWEQGIGAGWSSFAVAGGRAVTLEQRDDQECVTCYRLGDGELLWIQQHPTLHQNALGGIGPRSTPSIDGGQVYAQGATGRVWCLDLETGDPIWTVDLIAQVGDASWDQAASERLVTWGRSGSPLLIDDDAGRRLCVLPRGGPQGLAESGRSLIALDAGSGEVVWTAGQAQISFASPMVMTLAGRRQIVSVNEMTVTGHQVSDGQTLWSHPWPGLSSADANCASAIPAGKDRFLLGKGYGGGSALIEVSRQDSQWLVETLWESQRVLKTKFTHALVRDDVAFALSNGSLQSVQLETGDQLWQQPRSTRYQQGQIILVEDVIVAQSESGEVALVAADKEEFRPMIQIPAMQSKTWNLPTVAGRHLLIRNDRRAICYLLPPRE